jgi:heavy metal sensor kinase
MKTWPLRWRIAAWSALATGLALLTFIAAVAFNLYAEQVEMIDVRLDTNARLLLNPRGELNRDALAELAATRRGEVEAPLYGFALVGTRNRTVTQAQPADFARAVAAWPPRRWPPQKKFFNVTIERTRLRVAALAVGDSTLLLAAPLEPAEESVRDVLGSALLALPVVLLVVAAGGWWIARRALAPITAITRAAASITADRLGERLPAPATDDEIGAHVHVLNGMFDRLQRSFEQAIRFAADASHELRTPLTILRGEIEEALRASRGDNEEEKLLVSLLEQTSGLQKIADNLLLLARFDAGKAPLDLTAVDLSALVAEAVDDAEMLAAPQSIQIRAAITPGVRVDGDAVFLRRVLLNLIDNAVRYNRAGGEVRFTLTVDGNEVKLTLTNTGPGIPEERRPELFQRFFRLNPDRNRGTGGSGLGLSLCREILSAHGGRIELSRGEPDCTEFSVTLSVAGGKS